MTTTTCEKQPNKTFNNVFGGLSAGPVDQLWRVMDLYPVPIHHTIIFYAYLTYSSTFSTTHETIEEQKLTHF